jgi:hypothetical protein
MDTPNRLLSTELDGDDRLIVTFSDGTTGAYVAEELLKLRPRRERTSSAPGNLLWIRGKDAPLQKTIDKRPAARTPPGIRR